MKFFHKFFLKWKRNGRPGLLIGNKKSCGKLPAYDAQQFPQPFLFHSCKASYAGFLRPLPIDS